MRRVKFSDLGQQDLAVSESDLVPKRNGRGCWRLGGEANKLHIGNRLVALGDAKRKVTCGSESPYAGGAAPVAANRLVAAGGPAGVREYQQSRKAQEHANDSIADRREPRGRGALSLPGDGR